MIAMNNWFKNLVLTCAFVGFVTALSSIGFAQSGTSQAATTPQAAKKTEDNSPVKLSARFHVENGKTKGFLIVRAEIKKGNYIYGLDQKKPLLPTKMVAAKMAEIKSFGKFKADKATKVIENDPVFKTRIEKHTGTVQFYAPIEINEGVDPSKLTPTIEFSGQVCSDEGYCMPIDKKKVVAKFAGFFQRQAKGLPNNPNRR